MSQTGQCKKCGKRIMFIRMESGKMMPVDMNILNYKTGGKEKIVLPSGKVVSGTITSDPASCDGFGYMSHFATCEHAKMFRRKKRTAG